MRSELFHDILNENVNQSTLHSKRVCVISFETVALISVSLVDRIAIYEYNRLSGLITHRRDEVLKQHERPNVSSSTVSPSNTHVYSIDLSGSLFVTPLNDTVFDTSLPASLSSKTETCLQSHFKILQPCWADIVATTHHLLVSHGTLRTIHALSYDGTVLDYIKIGSYAAAITSLQSMPNVVATVEGSEVSIYDIRCNNHNEKNYAQRFFVGKEKLLALSAGSVNELVASGYSRSLAFVDIRTGRMGPQMATGTKYEVNFIHNENHSMPASSSRSQRNITVVTGTDSEMKVLDMNDRKVISTLYGDDCWCGRPSVGNGVFAGVSCRGSLLVADLQI